MNLNFLKFTMMPKDSSFIGGRPLALILMPFKHYQARTERLRIAIPTTTASKLFKLVSYGPWTNQYLIFIDKASMLKLCLGFDVTWHEINIYLLADIKNLKNQHGPRSMFIFKGSSKFMSDFKSARKFKNGKTIRYKTHFKPSFKSHSTSRDCND